MPPRAMKRTMRYRPETTSPLENVMAAGMLSVPSAQTGRSRCPLPLASSSSQWINSERMASSPAHSRLRNSSRSAGSSSRAALQIPESLRQRSGVKALAGLAGAKLFMFLFNFRDYWNDPKSIFTLSTLQAAGVYQGGFLLALVVAVLYMRHVKLPVFQTFDVFAPGIALGHAIGRLGCLAAGCCWGTECHLPWAITFTNPEANQITGVPLNIPLHPSQLYESLAEVCIFAALMWRIRKPHAAGEVFGLYLILYSSVRFLVEFVHNHEQGLILGLSLTQWISLVRSEERRVGTE